MKLSIVIVNWNTISYLRDCLASIFENTTRLPFEVIVVDNASHDGSAEMVSREFPLTKLKANTLNTGFAKGNNIGYATAGGDYIAILNPDTIVHPNVFAESVSYLQSHPEVGIVTCKLLNPDGTLQRGYYRRFPNLSTVFFCFTIVGSCFDRLLLRSRWNNKYFYEDKRFDTIEQIDQTGGTFMLISKAVVECTGLFDEQFPIFFNDVDLCKRIWQAGLEIHFLPHIAITHYGGRSVRQLGGWTAYKHLSIGCFHYFKKHHGLAKTAIVLLFFSLNLPLLVPWGLAVGIWHRISDRAHTSRNGVAGGHIR